MEFVMLPYALIVFYGAVVLGCGGTLGFVMGRNWRSRHGSIPPDHDDRLRSVEDELDLVRGELQHVLNELDYIRELESPAPDRIRRDRRLVA